MILCETLTETEKAYIAGFVDGEGSIALPSYSCRPTDPQKLKPLIAIYNTDLDVLQWIHKYFPESLVYTPTKLRHPKWKLVYQLRWESRKGCRNFLSVIVPYLRVKKRQAEILLAFCNRHHGRSKYFSEDWRAHEEMCILNSRG